MNRNLTRHAFRFASFAALCASGCADFPKSMHAAKPADKAKQKEAESADAAKKATPPPAPRINPMTHIAAGQMLERQNDFTGAIAQYEKAVVADPRLVQAYNRLGVCYQKLGQLPDAEQIFRQGLKAQPASAMLNNNLGYNFLLQKKYDDASECLSRALAVQPDFQRARMNLGIVFAHQRRLPEALAEFSKVVTADQAHYNLAVILAQDGAYPESEAALHQALTINPNCPGARRQLDRVAQAAKEMRPPGSTSPATRNPQLVGPAQTDPTVAP